MSGDERGETGERRDDAGGRRDHAGGRRVVCAVSGLSLADAASRFALANAALAEAPQHGSVTVGFAELRADDSPGTLVARADASLYETRRRQRESLA